MNKSVVCFLTEKGWSQSKIARKFNVDRSRICRIVNQVKKMKMGGLGLLCEVCNAPILRKKVIKLEKAEPLLVCSECEEQLSTLLT